jgi:hypothetical protein
MSGIPNLPETYDDLPDKRRFWPGAPGSEEEGLGMLRLLTPTIVAQAAQSQIQTGERVCLNWNMENLSPPGKQHTENRTRSHRRIHIQPM